MGIEPTLAAWEAAVLPLNYTRLASPDFITSHATLHARAGVGMHFSFRDLLAVRTIALLRALEMIAEIERLGAPATS